jgi:uncharacterized protein (TIGR03435 family)
MNYQRTVLRYGARGLLLAAFAVVMAMTPREEVLAQRPHFEVASMKINTTNGRSDRVPRRSGDLISMHNAQLYSLVLYAYHLHGSYEVTGESLGYGVDPWAWLDIDARVGHDATDDELRLMMQSLLEERLHMKVHRETREMPVYELTVLKGKSKLLPSSDAPMSTTIEGKLLHADAGTCSTSMWSDGAHLICHAVPVSAIVNCVIAELEAPAVDHTGLTGTFDLHIHYLPESRKAAVNLSPEEAVTPTMARALQEELGLKLEKSKGPVSVLVIDHFEKVPSEN